MDKHYLTATRKLFGPKDGLRQGEIDALFTEDALFTFGEETRKGSNHIEPFIFGWLWNQYKPGIAEPRTPEQPRVFIFHLRHAKFDHLKCTMTFAESGKIEKLLCNYIEK